MMYTAVEDDDADEVVSLNSSLAVSLTTVTEPGAGGSWTPLVLEMVSMIGRRVVLLPLNTKDVVLLFTFSSITIAIEGSLGVMGTSCSVLNSGCVGSETGRWCDVGCKLGARSCASVTCSSSVISLTEASSIGYTADVVTFGLKLEDLNMGMCVVTGTVVDLVRVVTLAGTVEVAEITNDDSGVCPSPSFSLTSLDVLV